MATQQPTHCKNYLVSAVAATETGRKQKVAAIYPMGRRRYKNIRNQTAIKQTSVMIEKIGDGAPAGIRVGALEW